VGDPVTPLLVAVGALVGAPLRLFITRLSARGGGDPARGTLVVNVVGSAVLGAVLGLTAVPGWVLSLVATGFCGTLTTFSAFGADVVRLLERSGGPWPTSAPPCCSGWAPRRPGTPAHAASGCARPDSPS
jgi:CrcB protein